MQSTSGHGPVCLKFSLSSRGNYEGALNERGISQNGKIRYLSNSGTLHQMAKHFSPDTTEQEEALFQGKIMDEYAASRVGHQFGNYRLIRLLGQGGFADVYLGEHLYLKTHAALKVLRLQLTNNALEDFLHEARTIARLEHPHIVRVLECGVERGTPFLVMNYAPNGTLRQHYARGSRLPLAVVVSYVQQIASALDYAHHAKLIHRDVKPENMLLGRTKEVLLSDFGLVLIAQSRRSQTTKEMAGTMPYMAPEQLQGKPRKASDQYSLGIVVYEWISGACPFQGTALEIAAQHLHVPPPSLRTKNPMIPLAVEEVVLRALTKNPQQRFTNVWAFAAALEQACQAAWGGSVGLPEVLTSEERIAPTGSSHAQHDPNESIYWTRRATDSSTIQQDAQVDTSGNRPAVSDRTPIRALPDSTFLFNQSLLDPSEFYGRVRERMVLLARVRKGESTSIVGSRRIGKTWLMQYLRLVAREELGSRFLVGYLDATAQRY